MVPNERESVVEQVSRWLVQRERWVADGGIARLELCETWREVTARYGEESPPALGCLLALVREAWGDRGISPVQHAAASAGWVWMMRGPERWRPTFLDQTRVLWTERDALVAALLAAPVLVDF